MVKKEIAIVTQARYGSSRLPGKVLKEVEGQTLLGLHLTRILQSQFANRVIVATTLEKEALAICNIASTHGATCFRGDTEDVLSRFYQAVKDIVPDYVVRLTADCPLIDPSLIDKIIIFTIDHNLDYCSNTLKETYPDGQDVEVFTFASLRKAWSEAQEKSEREHVTPFIRKHADFSGGSLFKAANFDEGLAWGHIRMTVDQPEDLEVIEALVHNLGPNASMEEYVGYLLENKTISNKNSHIGRNEGYFKSLKHDN